jgi:hypothetical protein
LMGGRIVHTMDRFGTFKLGLLVHIPLGTMPTYTFMSDITSNGNLYSTHTTTQSRQYNFEISLLYQLFHF